jgi:hypothetical protein
MSGGYRKCWEGIENVRRVSENFKTKLRVSIGYRKYLEGIGNIRRVSEILGGYRKCTKGIGKFKN